MQLNLPCKSDIKTKPTKWFWLLLFTIFLVFSSAYVHNNNLSYIFIFFLISISFISIRMGRKNIKKVELEIVSIGEFFANRNGFIDAFISAGYDIYIQNYYFKMIQNKKLIKLKYRFNKRGKYFIESEEVYSYYPFNLIRFSKFLKIEQSVIVYPELKGKSLDKVYFKNRNIFGYKDEFEGVKSYSQSDSITDIYWPSVAKGEIYSKKFSTINDNAILTFNYRELSGDKESRVSQIALWVVEAEKKGLKYRVILDKEVKGDRNEILKQLALY